MSRSAMVLERWTASEIQSFHKVNLIRGLLRSGMLQFIGLGSYWILPEEVRLISPPRTLANRSPGTVLWPSERLSSRQNSPQSARRSRAKDLWKYTLYIPLPKAFENAQAILDSADSYSSEGIASTEGGSSNWNGPSGIGEASEGAMLETRLEYYPEPTKTVKPAYPSLAQKAGIEGIVNVQALVDRNGRIKHAFVVKTDSNLLNAAALVAIYQWHFSPARMGNDSVAVWMVIPFKFTLSQP